MPPPVNGALPWAGAAGYGAAFAPGWRHAHHIITSIEPIKEPIKFEPLRSDLLVSGRFL